MKKSLNSDGNQFHQYKKYKHLSSYLNSPNTDTHTHNRPRQVQAWDMCKNVAGLNPLCMFLNM